VPARAPVQLSISPRCPYVGTLKNREAKIFSGNGRKSVNFSRLCGLSVVYLPATVFPFC
jgi:hypothetical protein